MRKYIAYTALVLAVAMAPLTAPGCLGGTGLDSGPTGGESTPGSTALTTSALDTVPELPVVAFTRWSYDAFEERIFLVSIDGSTITQLTLESGVQEHYPALSPDGRRIAFSRRNESSQFDIFIMNSDGTGRVRITNTGISNAGLNDMPAWSRDNRIAFISSRDGNIEVYVMNDDGTGQTNLTGHPGIDWLPLWSPDGTKIAFLSDRDGQFKWWVMGADGSNPRVLSDIVVSATDINVPLVLLQATWTMFMGGEGTLFTPVLTEEGTELIGINVATGQRRDLDFGDAVGLVESPDGSFIVTVPSATTDSLDLQVFGAEGYLTSTPEHDVATSCARLSGP